MATAFTDNLSDASRARNHVTSQIAGTKRLHNDTELDVPDGETRDNSDMVNRGGKRKKKTARHAEDVSLQKDESTHSHVSGNNDENGVENQNDSSGGEWQTIQSGRSTKKQLKKMPKKSSGNYPAITFSKNARLQNKIQVSDLRNLVTYLFTDGTAPQWVAVHHRPAFRKVVAILIPGLEESMFSSATEVDFGRWAREEDGSVAALERWWSATVGLNSSRQKNNQQNDGNDNNDGCRPRPLVSENLAPALRPFADVFPLLWPVRARGNERYATLFSPVNTFLTAPLPKSASQDGSTKKHHPPPQPHQDVRTRITEFLATPTELIDNDFLLHPALLPDAASRAVFADEPGWVHTAVENVAEGDVPEAEIEDGSITAGRTVYAVDCEMCKAAGDVFVLTRISVVAWDGTVVLDELVKPDEPIVDHLTQFSGITAAMLENVTTTRADIQKRLLALLNGRAILVGHSLDSDLRALQLTHPFIVDTSLAFPHPAGPPRKQALRWLSAKYLNREIQKGHGTARGHDSIEDARTCLDLMKKKCEKGKLWASGTAGPNAEWAGGEGVGENLFLRLGRAGTAYRNQGGPHATGGLATGKSTAAVDWGDPRRSLCSEAGIVIGGCRSDADVEAGIVRAVRGDPDGKEVPGGGVDFVYARMRCLEALQGWWNRNKLLAGTDESNGPPTLEHLREIMAEEEAEVQLQHQEKEGGELEQQAPHVEEAKLNTDNEKSDLERCLGLLGHRIRRIYDQLPPCTALIVFSGSGDPRAMSRLQAQRAQHKREYHTPGVKWDSISVPWTDTEEQLLRRAVKRARDGVGFVTVK